MRSNYKRLGDYIRQVDIRNKDDERYDLLGVSVEKCFISSIANTVGTDWHNYKIIKKGQFCYIPDTSRRGDKIGIAHLTDREIGLVSAVYTVFEVWNEELVPEYLMLWFKRPEFDRYARFHSHGSVREIFDWEEMCNVELPIPPIEEQKAIVNAYETIERRIALKRKINDNLEAQAKAIFNDRIVRRLISMDELPDGYHYSSLTSIANYLNGLAMQNWRPNSADNAMPVLKIRELRQGYPDNKSEYCSRSVKPAYHIFNGDVIFSWSGTLCVDIWCGGEIGLNQHLFSVTSNKYPKWFYYYWTKYYLDEFIRIADGMKTSMGHIKREHLDSAKVVIPSNREFSAVNFLITPLFDSIVVNKTEIVALTQSQNALLSRLSRR